MQQNALALDGTGAAVGAVYSTGDIGRHAVAAVVVASRIRRRRSRLEWLGFKTDQQAGDDIAGCAGARAVS